MHCMFVSTGVGVEDSVSAQLCKGLPEAHPVRPGYNGKN